MLVSSTKARYRVMRALACFIGPAVAGCGLEASTADGPSVDAVTQDLTTDVAIYANTSPATPWQDWSWWTTVSSANADAPLASGSTSQIKATVQTDGGALSLAHSTSDLVAADYDAITFDVRGPSSSTLRIAIETLGGTGSGLQPSVPVTTTWTRQTIKLDGLKGSLTAFGKIDWIASQAGQTFYIDNVKVVAKAPVTSTTTLTSSFPTAPLAVSKNDVVGLNSSAGPYSLYVPSSYDATHHTPAKLLLWMHGCGGDAYGDAWVVSPGGSQSWITVSVGGRDGDCWNPSTDVPMAIAALDDVKRRLNVDPRRVVIGGYSSGGDMAYRTAFYDAKRFAGVLAENTSPFRDTGSTQSSSHLAHLSDPVYPIGPVRIETDALRTAGFPETRLERAGTHWDADTATSGTSHDLRTYLLPYLDAGWVAPP
jgi:hypothetical protein